MENRKVYLNIDDVPKGSSILGVRVKEPSLIIVDNECQRDVFYPDDKECAWSNMRLVFVDITEEERMNCVDEKSTNELASKLILFIVEQLKIKNYKIV